MILSLANTGLALVNATAFLLLATGPALVDFILISTVFGFLAWLYSWIMPAACGYDPARFPAFRASQLALVAAGALLLLVLRPGPVAAIFAAMMIIDAVVFPQFMLLFQSRTNDYLRYEVVKGLANSLALLVLIVTGRGSPDGYALLLLINVAMAGGLAALTGFHRPPPWPRRWPGWHDIAASLQLTPQLRWLGAARLVEIGGLYVLGALGSLAAVLSFKIGMAISGALALNARRRGLAVLLGAHGLLYAGITLAIIAGRDQPWLPLPPSFLVIDPWLALAVAPVVVAAFCLSVAGLRQGRADP